MTVETLDLSPPQTIAPGATYSVPFPYVAGAVRAVVIFEGERIELDSAQFTVTPEASDTSGSAVLAVGLGTGYSGGQLLLSRETPIEQGWQAVNGSREAGLEAQLDQSVMSIQEAHDKLAKTIRSETPIDPVVPAPGRLLIWDENGNIVAGPNAEDIADAQGNAELAQIAAALAQLYAPAYFADRAALLASPTNWATGTILNTRLEGLAYKVAAGAALDHHATTAGGKKLYEAGWSFTTRARAAQAVTRGERVNGDIVTVAGKRFLVDAIGPDGLIALEMDFRGRLDRLSARMMQGDAVNIACFGDSTTDGNQTTGWTANPTDGGGDAVGGAAHTPPNAWPAIAQQAMRAMFGNNAINLWNAGYGGKRIITGWARNNFQRAIINNPGYGTPGAVIIGFGLNDAVDAAMTVDAYETELRNLLSLIDYYNALPILLTPDPVMENTLRQGGNLALLMGVQKRVAEIYGVPLLDVHGALLRAFNLPANNARWAFNQPDDLHGVDKWHSGKAGFIAAKLFPNTLWIDAGEDVVQVAPWSKHCNTDGLTYGLFDGANNHFGASLNVTAGSYATGQALINLWVWHDSAPRAAYWHSVDGDAFYNPRPLANAPQLSLYSYSDKAETALASATAGQAIGVAGRRGSETPMYLDMLVPGLSRLQFKAPTDTNANPVYLGHVSFRKRRLPMGAAQFIAPGGSGNTFWDRDPFNAGLVLPAFGMGRTMEMIFEASIPINGGLILWAERVFGDTAGDVTNDRRGVLLFRGPSNIQLWHCTFKADGSGALVGSVLATASYTWAVRNQFRVRGAVTGAGQQEIYLYDGWETTTALLTVQIPRGNENVPFGGHIGGAFKNYAAGGGTNGAAVLIVHDVRMN